MGVENTARTSPAIAPAARPNSSALETDVPEPLSSPWRWATTLVSAPPTPRSLPSPNTEAIAPAEAQTPYPSIPTYTTNRGRRMTPAERPTSVAKSVQLVPVISRWRSDVIELFPHVRVYVLNLTPLGFNADTFRRWSGPGGKGLQAGPIHPLDPVENQVHPIFGLYRVSCSTAEVDEPVCPALKVSNSVDDRIEVRIDKDSRRPINDWVRICCSNPKDWTSARHRFQDAAATTVASVKVNQEVDSPVESAEVRQLKNVGTNQDR